MHVVKSVGVMSVAKIMGLVYGCLGLIFVPIFFIAVLAGAFAGHNKAAAAADAIGLAFAILAPLIYGATGFVFGALGALLYNLIAKWVGGFEIELALQPAGLVAPYPIVPPPTPSI